MSIELLLQIVFDLVAAVAVFLLALRLRRPPQDDPRLSRGLQLLQTKITVLEDLSDRTDAQVKQLTSLIEQKTRVLQNKVIEAEAQLVKIDASMARSLEVAEIFQDKIPHREIVERRQKVEYVRAARLAHAGRSVEDIVAEVDLPREQVELIAKFNRERLLFDEAQLPEWAGRTPAARSNKFGLGEMDFLGALEAPVPAAGESRARVGDAFRASVEDARAREPATIRREEAVAPIEDEGSPLGDAELRRALEAKATVRKVNFPRVDRAGG